MRRILQARTDGFRIELAQEDQSLGGDAEVRIEAKSRTTPPSDSHPYHFAAPRQGA